MLNRMRTGPYSASPRAAGLAAPSSRPAPSLGPAAALIACLVTVLLAPPAAAAAPARLRPPAAPAKGEAARIARYWTAARMRSTPPLDAPAGAATRARLTATPSFAPVPTPTAVPFTVNGRLFINRKGRRGFCSATAINSASRRLVLTAGHCVNSGPVGRNGGSIWSRYLEFVPAYSAGVAPLGAFVARRGSVFAPRQWVRFGNPNFDVGAVLTEPNAEGIPVADAVGGGAALLVDRPRRQVFQTFGYPRRSGTMQGCESPYVGDDSVTYRLPGPPTIAIRCHWAPGASGGGWLVEGGTVLNGLTTYGKQRDFVHTFGPYFSRRNVGRLVAGL
jgi:V8-like Glu-specific endopeptidase